MLMVPFIAFWILLLVGVWLQELEIRTALLFLVVWGVGLVLCYLVGMPRQYYILAEAVLDCVLILKIFKGDIRIR